jgi:hypothetical protein
MTDAGIVSKSAARNWLSSALQRRLVGEGGDKDHGNVEALANLRGGRDSIAFSLQADVHQNQIGRGLFGERERLAGRRRPPNGIVAAPRDGGLDVTGDHGLVLDHQDLPRRHGHASDGRSISMRAVASVPCARNGHSTGGSPIRARMRPQA